MLNPALFMIVAVVVSHLANSMKRNEIARKRENEVSDLYAFSRRLAAAHSADEIYTAIEEHLASLVRRKVVLFGAAGGRAGRGGRATPDERVVPERVRAEVARAHSTLDHGRRRHRQHLAGVAGVAKDSDFGVIAIDLQQRAGERGRRRPPAGRRRLRRHRHARAPDVARALNDAKMRSETELLREALIGSVSHEPRHAARLDPRLGDGAVPSRR